MPAQSRPSLLTRTPPAAPRRTQRATGPVGPVLVRILGVIGVILACLVLVAPWALFTARTEANFGPHVAVYSVTADATITVDFGPLGELLIPADGLLPLGLGAQVDVEEIPAESALGGTTLDALGQDIASYATFFTAPEAQLDAVARGLIRDFAVREFGAGLGLAAVVGVLAVLSGPRQRFRPPRARAAVGAVSGTVVVLLIAALVVPIQRPRPIDPNPAFVGTPLEGAQVTGRLSGVIDEVAKLVADFASANDAFYTTALQSLDSGWEERPLTVRLTPGSSLVPPPTEGVWRGAEAGEHVITAVFASDLHCNVGMTRVVADVVARADADLYIDGGDITMTGTPAENYCLDSLDHELPDGLPKVFVKGNHDSLDTVAHARGSGWTVLDGEPVEVAGLRFFGDGDPRRTVFGQPEPLLETGETTAEFTSRMTTESCAAEPDVLLIHDPRQAQESLGVGCARFALHGHWHRRVGPEPFGRGARFVNSTTGGALANALTPGPLKMPAELTIIRFDGSTGTPLDLQVVTVDMAAQAEISPWLRIPQPGPWLPQSE
ncbi:hypothetical protein GCM10022261_22740 [Brevibacterium daeguense]|uniref:Calcineurin-like phosphoesterase domain-containing protein n=1 Tax=Brevibacterium daeguense TaxID=909936 RepID=A0ABP8ELB1_9MICO|nr:metallophosphoesterase [Brevibacterium daeguense]